MIADHYRNPVASWFDDVMSATRHQASTYERDISEPIQRCKLADGIEQEHAAGDRLLVPQRAPPETNSESLQQCDNVSEALWMARRQNHDRLGIARQHIFKCLQQERFFVLSRTAANDNR